MTILARKRTVQLQMVGALRHSNSTSSSNQRLFSTTDSINKLRIYTGTPPASTDEYIANGQVSYASQLAYEFTDYNMMWYYDVATNYSGDRGNTLSFDPPPTISTAPSAITGTATWFVAKGHNESRIIMGSVGGPDSTDPVRLDTVNLTSGVDFTIYGFSITIANIGGA